MTDFITAIQKNVSIIRSHTGTVLGFAQKHDVSITFFMRQPEGGLGSAPAPHPHPTPPPHEKSQK